MTVAPDELDAIRRHVQCQHAYGSNRFLAAIKAQLGRPIPARSAGRTSRMRHNAAGKGHSDPGFGLVLTVS
jgi:hypothetical protein